MKSRLFFFLILINSTFASFFHDKFGTEEPQFLAKTFVSQLQTFKEVKDFDTLNTISEQDEQIVSSVLTNLWDLDENGFSISTFALYARDASKKDCDELIRKFLQDIASHSLALAAIKKNSFALGCIGQCSKTAKLTLKNSRFDLPIDEIINNSDYKTLTSLIKKKWVIGKK